MNGKMIEINIENVIQKLEFYKRIENQNFDEIINCFKLLNDCYKTSNTSLFEEISNIFKKKFNTINEYTGTNIFIYNKNLETYRQATKDSNEILKNDIKTL